MEQGSTIAAIATPLGTSGIGVIRMSGPQARQIAARVFVKSGRKKLSQAKSYTLHHGKIVDRDGSMIDEVLLLWMKGPGTYTGEDTVEIDTHGGAWILQRALGRLLEAGAVMATPGEFTRRAFLNGKLDLSQAEAVMDMIHSTTDRSLQAAARRLEGKLSSRIDDLRKKLMDLLVLLEVEIDYPEYEIEEAQQLDQEQTVTDLLAELEKLYQSADTGRMLNDGVKVVLCGRPNMGKSTLLNTLLGQNRAIVTEIPGTTRDTIEERVDMDGIPVRFIDTAGIRETQDPIEKIGVDRTRKAMEEADLILYLVSVQETLCEEDREVLQQLSDKTVILIRTKLDERKTAEEKDPFLSDGSELYLSAKTGEGMEKLREAVQAFVMRGSGETDGVFLANLRQKQAVWQAICALKQAQEAFAYGSDMVSMEVTRAFDALGELSGEKASEELIDTIFSRFCLGK